jgi:hypothetical protein
MAYLAVDVRNLGRKRKFSIVKVEKIKKRRNKLIRSWQDSANMRKLI